jgi:2-polyprenyl-3-methyl-5-hydroxy-6-metoxy-1,4-benzoquinol methylase
MNSGRRDAAPSEFGTAPEIATEAVDACVVCGASEAAVYAQGYDYELRTCSNLWTFVQCASCGHVWLNPRPAVSTLSTIYPPHYYAYDYETRVNAIARRGKAMLDAMKLGAIIKRLDRPPRSFIDIGCGTGRYLYAMAERGLPRTSIHGLELDERVVQRLASDGFAVEHARAEDAQIREGSIDLATMFHVIEHVDAPDRVAKKIARWLAPGGVLAVETPNLDSLDRRLFARTYWGGYHIPRHWHLFTPDTLARLLRSAGLEPIATLFQTGHSFWMYSMHHWFRYAGTPHPRIARVFDPFTGVVPLAAFTAFDKVRAALGARTSAMLMLARRAA